MGNSAYITTTKEYQKSYCSSPLAIYLHWNGGLDSVKAFLKYCELHEFRNPNEDSYGMARLVQVISNFFGASGLSIGIEKVDGKELKSADNGCYVVGNWKIEKRLFNGFEQNEYNMEEMLLAIDEAQPVKMQIGEFLRAKEVDVKDLKIDDEVVIIDWINDTKAEKFTVKGIGKDGIPYVNRFGDEVKGYSWNDNNYLNSNVKFRKVENKTRKLEKSK